MHQPATPVTLRWILEGQPNTTTLHARRGAYIRELGFNAAAVICGMVVAFSWWGVNLLGVGLHSYGFTSGAITGLMIFWSIEMLVVLAGVIVWAKERGARISSSQSPSKA